MNVSLLFLMLLSSFTGQVKTIYCFSALARIFTIRQFCHVFFLLWPSTFCSPFTFAVILSPVSRFARISSLCKANFGCHKGSKITVTVSWCGFEGPDS